MYWCTTADTPVAAFPVGIPVVIEEGWTADKTAHELKRMNAVSSALYTQMLMRTTYRDSFIRSGSYTFTEPRSTTEVLRSLVSGKDATPLISVTFPEGFKVAQMLEYLPETYENEDSAPYQELEGYLFPDTYFIETDDTLDDIVTRMHEHYESIIAPLRDEISESPFSEKDVVILASLLEREANDETSMKLVSGILQNRLREGMPLQVDATLDYLFGKASHELTIDDLAYDSPYNTYVYTGLPPTPIANPGLTAIHAVLLPTTSPYLYYLTDNDGNFHYARTHDEHTQNKARYLR